MTSIKIRLAINRPTSAIANQDDFWIEQKKYKLNTNKYCIAPWQK